MQYAVVNFGSNLVTLGLFLAIMLLVIAYLNRG